jgi:hypothetical protein
MPDTCIVTTTYRHKRPPRNRKAVALEVPAIVARKKEPPLRPRIAAAEAVSQSPAFTTGQRSQTHRAMRNVTAP